MNNIYKPYIEKFEEWGKCEDEQRKDFVSVFDKFSKELKEAISSLAGVIELEKYDRIYETDARNNNNRNQDMLNHFEKLFKEWIDQIEKYIEETETVKTAERDPGPKSELEFWRKRMQKLTCISEQLRSKNCRTVYTVLSSATQNPNELKGTKGDIFVATSKWKNIELRVTEALNEAKDNVKYLTTLEKFIEPLYDGTPDTIKDTLPALMNSIKMIHTIARYYNTNDRMTGLFIKITNQMIANCKKAIL